MCESSRALTLLSFGFFSGWLYCQTTYVCERHPHQQHPTKRLPTLVPFALLYHLRPLSIRSFLLSTPPKPLSFDPPPLPCFPCFLSFLPSSPVLPCSPLLLSLFRYSRQEYFGEKYALFYTWWGYYITMLWLPALVGVALFVSEIMTFLETGAFVNPYKVAYTAPRNHPLIRAWVPEIS